MGLFGARRRRNEFTGHLPESATTVAPRVAPGATQPPPRPSDPEATYLLIGRVLPNPGPDGEMLLLDGREVIHEPAGYTRLYRFFARPRTESEARDFLRAEGLHEIVLDVLVDWGRLLRWTGRVADERLHQLRGLHLYPVIERREDVRIGDAVVRITVPTPHGSTESFVSVDPVTARLLLEAPRHIDVPSALRMAVERGTASPERSTSNLLADLPRLLAAGVAFLGPTAADPNREPSLLDRLGDPATFRSLFSAAGPVSKADATRMTPTIDWRTGGAPREPWHQDRLPTGIDASNKPD